MKSYFVTCCLILASLSVAATHLRSGSIHVKRSGNGYTCIITITVYTNTKNTPVKFGGDPDISYLYFGDGTREYVPEQDNIIRYDLDPSGSIAIASFTTMHEYSAEGEYVISYQEPNRNGGILNMDYSIVTLFFVDTYINLNSDFKETPISLAPPIFYGSIGNEFTASLACSSQESDFSYFYYMTTPRSDDNIAVVNYRLPPSFKVNKFNGLISWDTKFLTDYVLGEYAFSVKILQYKGDVLISYVTEDFQIILNDNPFVQTIKDNQETDENGRIYVPEGSLQTIKIFAEDEAGGDVELALYAELPYESFTFSISDSVNGDRKIKVGELQISNTELVVRDNPYPIIVRATSSKPYYKDISYLFYSKDVELEAPEIPDVVLQTENEENSAVKYYPNPVKDFLFLNVEGEKSIKLYGNDGKVILESANHRDTFIDLRNVKQGTYLLQLKTKRNKTSVIRVVKK